jgi:hypothetical protein
MVGFVLLPALLAGPIVVGSAAEHSEEWVRDTVRRIKDSDTKGWRQIPWTASLLDARRSAKKENLPIFLFTHDGNIDSGRC